MKLSGKLFGIFKFYSAEPGFFDTNELALIDELVEDISFSVEFIYQNAEQERMEKEMKENDELFRELTDNISEVFWMIDVSTRSVLYVSPAFERIWGHSRQALYDSPDLWNSMIHPDDRHRVHEIETVAQTATTFDTEYRIVRPDGSIRWIHNMAFPVRNTDGIVYRIGGIAEDITERKRVEESKETLEAQLQQAQKLESLGTLASGIAHDFNNILGIIIAHSSILARKGAEPGQVTKSAETILMAGNRGAGLVKQMLTFARKTESKTASIQVNDIHETQPGNACVRGRQPKPFPKRLHSPWTSINHSLISMPMQHR